MIMSIHTCRSVLITSSKGEGGALRQPFDTICEDRINRAESELDGLLKFRITSVLLREKRIFSSFPFLSSPSLSLVRKVEHRPLLLLLPPPLIESFVQFLDAHLRIALPSLLYRSDSNSDPTLTLGLDQRAELHRYLDL